MTGLQQVSCGRTRPKAWQRAFTMIELMVVVALIAIIAMLAAPSFNEAILSARLKGIANSFVASAQLARSEAIKRNATVTLCIMPTSLPASTSPPCTTTGDWEQGWNMYFEDKTTTPSTYMVIQPQQALPAGYRLTADSTKSIGFETIGAGATSVTLKLCRASPSVGAQDREIKVSLTGRTSVSTTHTGTCS